MTSSEIRASFLDFFKEKQHTIVPSSSLLPDAPNLLFTNAGMNQFVPIFLGQTPCPYTPARAADTQKCIRAGGKHNDLEDVGFDTYHHTFFEMLGNWSFGDYFKKEAIAWAWELVVGRWKFPASRIYATIYSPGTGDPASLDREAHEHWSEIFIAAGLDPSYHVVHGNKKDNFWMMGDTGPCGPCSELHVDLTPGPRDLDIRRQIDGRNLVNQGDARCIEIWNLVFIQFNANPDGTFVDLPSKHVDTGMGFERVASMIQGTKGFTDFENAKISNYETDVFRPIFDELEKLTGKKYGSTLPSSVSAMELKEINFHLNLIELEHDYGVKIRHAEEALREGRKVRLQLKFRGVEMGRQDEGMNLISRMRADLSQHGSADAEPKLTGKSIYLNLSPLHKNKAVEDQLACDVAFRVIADHIRTLSFSIADGIQPSNEGRGYVLRRILRRAVRYGRNLGLREPFLGKLVAVLGATMGHIFPEVVAKADLIRKTLTNEEESFLGTLEKGLVLFDQLMSAFGVALKVAKEMSPHLQQIENAIKTGDSTRAALEKILPDVQAISRESLELSPYNSVFLPYHLCVLKTAPANIESRSLFYSEEEGQWKGLYEFTNEVAFLRNAIEEVTSNGKRVWGHSAFLLYDTYGFPLDLTELMAREHGTMVDVEDFKERMEEQKARSKAAQKKEVISVEGLDSEGLASFVELIKSPPTRFTGFDELQTETTVVAIYNDNTLLAASDTPFYTEMGGQVGDTGKAKFLSESADVLSTSRSPKGQIFHKLSTPIQVPVGEKVQLFVNAPRRAKIEAHHSGTHLMNWALRKVLGNTITQKGSYVGPDRLRFDFSHGAAMTPAELAEVERLVNEKIEADVPVKWEERAYTEVKGDPSILQFFGDKYGDMVRVVSIGDFSKELCGGTHVRQSGKVGYFKILHEAAIAAGIRRIEAASGDALRAHLEELIRKQDEQVAVALRATGDKENALADTVARSATATTEGLTGAEPAPATSELWQRYKDREKLLHDMAAQRAQHEKDEAKRQEAAFQKRAAETAPDLIGAAADVNGVPFLAVKIDGAPAAYLPFLADALKTRWQGVAVLATVDQGKVALLAAVAPSYAKKIQAGKIIQAIAPLVGGKGGGRSELAQGGGTNPDGVAAALAKAEEVVRAV